MQFYKEDGFFSVTLKGFYFPEVGMRNEIRRPDERLVIPVKKGERFRWSRNYRFENLSHPPLGGKEVRGIKYMDSIDPATLTPEQEESILHNAVNYRYIEIPKGEIMDLPHLERCETIIINEGGRLNAPKLSNCDCLIIKKRGELRSPLLPRRTKLVLGEGTQFASHKNCQFLYSTENSTTTFEGVDKLVIKEGTSLFAPSLKEVGEVNIEKGAKLIAPNIMSADNIVIEEDGTIVSPILNFSKKLTANSGASISAPLLEIAKIVNIFGETKVQLPSLKEAENIVINSTAIFSAPLLSKVNYSMFIYDTAEVDAPILENVLGTAHCDPKAKTNAPCYGPKR